mgnify:CR=1 FL=1
MEYVRDLGKLMTEGAADYYVLELIFYTYACNSSHRSGKLY